MLRIVAASFCFAVMAAFARLAGGRLPAQEVVLFRALIAALITFGLVRRRGAPLLGARPALLAVRGVTGFLGLSCYFWSVLHLPFNEAVLLSQVNPIFTALLAWAFLGERPGRRFAPAAVLVFAGVLFTSPPDPSNMAGDFWALVALAGAFFSASAYTEVRALSRTEHPLTIVLWFQLISTVLAAPGTALSGPVWPRGLDWLWLAGVGVAGHLGQVQLTFGLKKSPAGRGTLANPLVVIFGAALAWLIFGEGLDWGDLVGAGLLVGGLLWAGAPRKSPAPSAAPGTGAD